MIEEIERVFKMNHVVSKKEDNEDVAEVIGEKHYKKHKYAHLSKKEKVPRRNLRPREGLLCTFYLSSVIH